MPQSIACRYERGLPPFGANRAGLFLGRIAPAVALIALAAVPSSPALANASLSRLDAVTSRLAAASLLFCEDYELDGRIKPCSGAISVVDKRGYNAWSRDDRITLTRRMFAQSSDDELAFVIAHEMAHIILGHGRSTPANELEADYLGARIAKLSGYDAGAARRVFVRLEGRNFLGLNFARLTHPSGARRLAAVERALAEDVVLGVR